MNCYGNENRRCENRCREVTGCRCLRLITAIFGILFVFTLGLIIGAVIVGTVLENLAAFIVTAVIFFVLTEATLIYRRCNCRRN